MRPNPLMPQSVTMDNLVEEAADLLDTAAPLNALGATKAEADPARAITAAALIAGAIVTSAPENLEGKQGVEKEDWMMCVCRHFGGL